MKLRRRSLVLSVSAVAGLSAAAVCVSVTGSHEVAVPDPPAEVSSLCRDLHRELPGSVQGLAERTVEPPSDLTAGWGDPAIVLRCGVSRPAVLTPGNAQYNPLADQAEVNGVIWLLEKQDDGYRFTTAGRKAFVEVTVPGKYYPEVDPLTELADAVIRTVPTTL